MLRHHTFLRLRPLRRDEVVKVECDFFCAGQCAACVDALPTFQAELAAGTKFYLESCDEHPLPLGYAIYAKVTKEELVKFGVIK